MVDTSATLFLLWQRLIWIIWIGTDAYINSGGIAVLIQILSQTKQNNQKIGITGVSNHYKKIMRMVGVANFAEIHDTVESAVQMMAWKKSRSDFNSKNICKLFPKIFFFCINSETVIVYF